MMNSTDTPPSYCLYIRADGHKEIGLGHLVRCIALAEMVRNEANVHFICRDIPEALAADLAHKGFAITQIQNETDWVHNLTPFDLVVLDGYHFGITHQRQIKAKGAMLVCIDDLHEQAFEADLIINHAPNVRFSQYSARPATRWALGPDYALLRPAFLSLARQKRHRQPPLHQMLICFGGGDPLGLSERCLRVALQHPQLTQITVVLGAAYGSDTSLKALAAQDKRVRCLYALDEAQMAQQFEQADVAIVPASGILLEALAAGCVVVSGQYTPNQQYIYEAYRQQGAFVDAGAFAPDDLQKALALALGQHLPSPGISLDGRSGERLSRLMRELAQAAKLSWQQATSQHLEQTLSWASDPSIRAFSFNNRPISREEHTAWFERKIQQPHCLYLIAYEAENAIGSIRFDLDPSGSNAVISYLVDPRYQGRSYGVSLLAEGMRHLVRRFAGIRRISGQVMPQNIASVKAFQRLGFDQESAQPAQLEAGSQTNTVVSSLSFVKTVLPIMSNHFQLGHFDLAPNGRVFIIAELSANHNGSLETALATIKAARRAGADAIKLQTYTPDTITIDAKTDDFRLKQGTIWDGKYLYDLYQEAYTPWEWHAQLFEAAREEGLICFSSPFDKTAVDLLVSLDAPAYKIASFEITDIPLISYVAAQGKPVIISTGIAEEADIQLAVDTCRAAGNDQIVLLKCTSSYPAPIEEANLLSIPDLAQRFGVISGLSDHTMGITAPVVATTLGAKVIEKHFILDRAIGGPDASFSLDEAEFTAMVQAVRQAEAALGQVSYTLTDKQRKGREFSRSLYVVEDVAAGQVFTEQNLRSIRPGYGLHPRFYPDVLGKVAAADFTKGHALKEGDWV